MPNDGGNDNNGEFIHPDWFLKPLIHRVGRFRRKNHYAGLRAEFYKDAFEMRDKLLAEARKVLEARNDHLEKSYQEMLGGMDAEEAKKHGKALNKYKEFLEDCKLKDAKKAHEEANWELTKAKKGFDETKEKYEKALKQFQDLVESMKKDDGELKDLQEKYAEARVDQNDEEAQKLKGKIDKLKEKIKDKKKRAYLTDEDPDLEETPLWCKVVYWLDLLLKVLPNEPESGKLRLLILAKWGEWVAARRVKELEEELKDINENLAKHLVYCAAKTDKTPAVCDWRYETCKKPEPDKCDQSSDQGQQAGTAQGDAGAQQQGAGCGSPDVGTGDLQAEAPEEQGECPTGQSDDDSGGAKGSTDDKRCAKPEGQPGDGGEGASASTGKSCDLPAVPPGGFA